MQEERTKKRELRREVKTRTEHLEYTETKRNVQKNMSETSSIDQEGTNKNIEKARMVNERSEKKKWEKFPKRRIQVSKT